MKKGLVPGVTLAAALAFAAAPARSEEGRGAPAPAPHDAAAAAAEPADPGVVAFEEAPTHIFLTREANERASARQSLARRTPNMT